MAFPEAPSRSREELAPGAVTRLISLEPGLSQGSRGRVMSRGEDPGGNSPGGTTEVAPLGGFSCRGHPGGRGLPAGGPGLHLPLPAAANPGISSQMPGAGLPQVTGIPGEEAMTSQCRNCAQSHPSLGSPGQRGQRAPICRDTSWGVPKHRTPAERPGWSKIPGRNSLRVHTPKTGKLHPPAARRESPPAAQRMQLMGSGCFPLKTRPSVPGKPPLPPLSRFLGPSSSQFLPAPSPARHRRRIAGSWISG